MCHKIELKKVEKFSLYLISKYKIDSALKIQKILFFLRVYEKRKSNDFHFPKSPIFDKDNKNFQAWMYGPVNVVSYYFTRLKLYSSEQESNDDVLMEFKDAKKIDEFKKYENIINKLKEIDSQELVYYSHHNIEYKNVRKGLNEFEPCKKELDESNDNFAEFDDEVKDKIDKIFSIN